MTDEKALLEKEQKLREALTGFDFITLKAINTVPDHYKGPDHFFCIGPAHVGYANKHGGVLLPGIVDESGHGCYATGCNKKWSEHFTAEVAFLQLTRNATKKEGNELMTILKPVLKLLEITGMTMVETKEKFRFVEDEA